MTASPEGRASGAADRELRAETVVDASPDRVWRLLSDVRRMSDWSPELVRMVPLRRGGMREGQWYLGLNRRKGVVWPTRSVVSALDLRRSLTWDTRTSGARWVWEISPAGEGTRVVHRRPVPAKLTRTSTVFARFFLGGGPEHADELEAGMAHTLTRLKAAAEQG